MNRTLKFRAWDNTNSEMVYEIQSITFARNGEPANADIGFSTPVIANGDDPQAVIMQFTGLLDKNGKEIYEGDIVTIDGSITAKVMKFNNGSFALDGIYGGSEAYRMEVIGNIYAESQIL